MKMNLVAPRFPSKTFLKIHGRNINRLMKNVQFIFSILILACAGTTHAAVTFLDRQIGRLLDHLRAN